MITEIQVFVNGQKKGVLTQKKTISRLLKMVKEEHLLTENVPSIACIYITGAVSIRENGENTAEMPID